MICYLTTSNKKSRLVCILLWLVIPAMFSTSAAALDLLPSIFKNTKINRNIWKQQEQFVALAPQSDGDGGRVPPNQHPVILQLADAQDALKSLELWVEGGLFRNEEAVPVLTSGQVTSLVRYMIEGLAQAKPDEDVVFVVRGYAKVALDIAKEKMWTAGRIFYKDDKLNLIIGTYQLKKDRGVRQAEGAHGVLDNYADLHFDHGNRDGSARMPGRIVTSPGVSLNTEHSRERPDWVQIDVLAAAEGYRDSLVPDEDRKREKKVKQEAAKLTVERRQMREEMARLRKELEGIKSGAGGQVQGLEERLATLKALKDKQLISDDEFHSRRQAILEEI
ncbi:MAG: hypothetical protein O3C28_04820 [Proteobacteria bacterium]|nr:hypothetical protein [Pseudomonadota bacterium]